MSVIGIAFGNTSSSIAYVNAKGAVDVIASPDGERAIPSVLSYVGGDEYHGGQALQQLVRNAANTVVNFRDFVGRDFAACDGGRCAAGAPLVDVGGRPGFALAAETVTVDEIVTRHLRRLKHAAEDYIGGEVSRAVVAVPSDFSAAQRAALAACAAGARLEVVQFVNEPSAALLAHVERFPLADRDNDANFVVADFGGVRSDAAVVAVRNGIFTVLASSHDQTLGGDQLDAELVEYFAGEFEKKNHCNPRKNARSMAKLRASSSITKKTLSNATSATISIDSLADGFDYHASINRMRFELVTSKVFGRFSEFVEGVIGKAGLDVLDIDYVLLSGGVAFTPKLSSNLEFLFPESVEILGPQHSGATNYPNELAASGAALQAALLAAYDAEELQEALQPVVINTPHIPKPIGILGADGEFIPVFRAETSFPTQKKITLKKASGDLLISVYEADHHIEERTVEAAPQEQDEEDSEEWSDDEPEIVREKHYTPTTKLMDLGVKNVTKGLQIVFSMNKNGQLKVVAKDLKSGQTVKGEL